MYCQRQARDIWERVPRRKDKATQVLSAARMLSQSCWRSSGVAEPREYQIKKIPKNRGMIIFSNLIVFLFKLCYFRRFVSSSGKTRAGLKFLASSCSMIP